jgi:hypothetical protein
MARATAALVALTVAMLVGCGSSSSKESSTVAGNADADAVQVIEDWANELRAGDVAGASDRFAIPSIVQNGTTPLRLTNRTQVEVFNQSLPCGARLTAASSSGKYTIATFVLTERPGPGQCGNGVGEAAKTAFVIHDGHITEWRRVVDTEPTGPTSTAPLI